MINEANHFQELGYAVYPALLSSSQSEHYKSKMGAYFALQLAATGQVDMPCNGFHSADAVTQNAEFWDLIFHDKLLHFLKGLLKEDIRYTQHSDLHVNHGTVGWHRDSACRRFGVGPDWDETKEPYRIVRVAIYLQDFARTGFSFGVIPKSHRYESIWTRYERKIGSMLFGRFQKLPPLMTTAPQWIPVQAGDCIVFDQRLLHTGSHYQHEKYAIFLSYGAGNHHSKRHRRYYLHERQDLKYQDYPPRLAQRLKEHNLYLGIE